LRQCTADKKNGERCENAVYGSLDVCWHHDPANAKERVRTASRGGRGKVNKEAREVKALMNQMTAKVLSGDVTPAVSHAVVALQNIKLRAIEVERRLDEADVRAELEELKRELGLSA
jgi:hypothetical protein